MNSKDEQDEEIEQILSNASREDIELLPFIAHAVGYAVRDAAHIYGVIITFLETRHNLRQPESQSSKSLENWKRDSRVDLHKCLRELCDECFTRAMQERIEVIMECAELEVSPDERRHEFVH